MDCIAKRKVTALEGSSLGWKVGFFDPLKARNFPQAGLQVDWLVDPNDYGRPLVFDAKKQQKLANEL